MRLVTYIGQVDVCDYLAGDIVLGLQMMNADLRRVNELAKSVKTYLIV